jgi:murein DD-endopeptidase MepM/ murein hydrolase activator NlpD
MAQQSPFDFREIEKPLKNRLIIKKTSKNDLKRGYKSEGQSIGSLFVAIYKQWFIVLLFIILAPTTTNAGAFSTIKDVISDFISNSSQENKEISEQNFNSQNVPLLQSAVNFDLSGSIGGGDITIVDNDALVSESGPSGTLADISDTVSTGQISKYVVRKGDTLSEIAKMFGVSTNTIVWANDVNAKTLKEGQVLVILPVSGTIHTVVAKDTLSSIAEKYKADSEEIIQFNNLEDGVILSLGDTLIIPDGEGSTKVSGSTKTTTNNPYRGGSGPSYEGYYIRPVVGGVKTQGLHGYNGIDIASYYGSNILAAASGEVIISRSSGWNGGYGNYIVISHSNGTQTLYSHLSENLVSEGSYVRQSQVIGLMGNTGKVIPGKGGNGTHLHFEIRGAKNPF